MYGKKNPATRAAGRASEFGSTDKRPFPANTPNPLAIQAQGQRWSPDGVRQERTGWRDQSISARHRPDCWAFRVRPLKAAKAHFEPDEIMCERELVSRLYRMRRLCLARELDGGLNTDMPIEVLS